jgi:transcriptional repressor NrdR
MTYILKRITGDREAFEAEKIRRSVLKAYVDSGKCLGECEADIQRIANEVISIVRKEEAIETRRIRDLVVERLEIVQPAAAESWKRFEERYKKK